MGAVVALTNIPGAQLIIPVSCLITAWSSQPKDVGLIDYLTRLARQDGSATTEVVPLQTESWPAIARLMTHSNRMDLATAHAAAVAMDRRVPLITDAPTARTLNRFAPDVSIDVLP
jgi:hypothetical protein